MINNVPKYFYTKRIKELKRVVVTGLGTVNPIGTNVDQSWQNLINQNSGIIRIKEHEQFKDNPNYPDIVMAPVHQDFDTKQWRIPFTNNNSNIFALAATQEAIKDSNLDFPSNNNMRLRTGVNMGVMSSNITKLTDILLDAGHKGFDKLNRLTILQILTNMPTANIAIKYNLQGPSQTASTACSTGASAIGESFRAIQLGISDLMIAGGTEDSVCPTTVQASLKLKAMTTKQWDCPSQSSRPFDTERSGFILSEGSGAVILEELEHALNRNAKIYCEITGYGQSSDGYHLTRPLETGDGALRSMKNALDDAEITIKDIDSINCHATSTPTGDLAENRALYNLMENNPDIINKISITAPKSQIGHTFGAAGAIESIFTIKQIQNNLVPTIKNLENPLENSELNFVRNNPLKQNLNYVLKNAFGFGGVNVTLAFKKFEL